MWDERIRKMAKRRQTLTGLQTVWRIGIIGLGVVLIAGGLQAGRALREAADFAPLPATVLLEDRYGNFLAEISPCESLGFGYWDLPETIPPRIEAAFLAIEDKRFYQHSGIDWRSVLRAAWHNLTHRRRQGASTIAMQVARMQRALSDPARLHQRTYWNKFCESLIALRLIRKAGHQAVLRQYLQLAPQGNRIHGAAYAARRYFRKPLQDVSWAEAALLAALPKAPGRMNLFHPAGRQAALARADAILRLLHRNGALDAPRLLAAQRQLHALDIPAKAVRPAHSYHAILRLADQLAEQPTPAAPARPVRTTLDLRLQAYLAQTATETLDYYRASGAGNMALIVVETSTGKVVGYLGSQAYYDAAHAGAINYAAIPRSSGSTLKPFIYALGLESGYFSPASLLSDMPILIPLPRGHHRIGNYDDKDLGALIYRKALANSRNVPAIHVVTKVGVERTYALFRQLGLAQAEHSAWHYGVGLAVGTLYVTLEDLVAAYGTLANDGEPFALRWFESRPPQAAQTPEQIISEPAARQMSLFLSDPLARLPTFPRMGPLEYPFPVAVKTGTSQGFRDAWAVAYSPRYIVGVWIGHSDNSRMNGVSGLDAAQVVKNVMFRLHPDERRGVGGPGFPPPAGYHRVKLCASTGSPVAQDSTDRCAEVVAEYFRPGTEPTRRQPVYQAFSSPETVIRYPSIQPLNAAPKLMSFGPLLNAAITIREPVSGSTFWLDPETPPALQTLALRAVVHPPGSEILWQVDGQPFTRAAYPYTTRWPLTPGAHTIRARFAHADIVSDSITITVY